MICTSCANWQPLMFKEQNFYKSRDSDQLSSALRLGMDTLIISRNIHDIEYYLQSASCFSIASGQVYIAEQREIKICSIL